MKKIGNIFLGIILFLGSFCLLWWNEGNSARKIGIAKYAQKYAVEVNSNDIQRENDNKLIATNGLAQTSSTLGDEFVISPDTLVLKRNVKMYQWIEEKRNDKTTYRKDWSDFHQNSDMFEDRSYKNPRFPINSDEFYADSATFGQYILSKKQIKMIEPQKDFLNLEEKAGYTITDNQYYSGQNIAAPKIGDVLISYNYAPSNSEISIIGEQRSDNSIVSAENKKLGEIYIQFNGKMTKDEIIKTYRTKNRISTMIFRFLGWLLMFIGLKLVFEPLTLVLKFIPILGKITNSAISLVLGLISAVLSLFTIAIAWFAYRPVLSILLILIGIIIGLYIKENFVKADK